MDMSKRDKRGEFLPPDVCPALMTKTMALNPHYRRTETEEYFSADVAIFYCLQTMREFGPDADDVDPRGCRPGRGCWCGGDPT